MGADNKLRGSLFGGFNRKDVVSYIEKNAQMSNEYKASSEKWEAKCVDLEMRLQEALAANASAVSAKNRADEELAGLQAHITELENEITELKALDRLRSEELDALKSRLSEYEETIGLYERSKERIALLELNASRRAVNIEKAAEEKAADLTKRCYDLIDALKSEYENICMDTESTAAHIKGEMDKLGARLMNLSELLNSKVDTLSQLDSIVNHSLEDPMLERF
ncbi:MAG: hypothetical protein GX111_11770 [Clostridiales bacterium]|nr:hypothetical protein [Clostridiales bacterium]